MECSRCQLRDRFVGLLCADCAGAIATPLVPQQIGVAIPMAIDGALVDQWGRPHPLGASTEIGRTVASSGLMISDVSVSRRHALIARVRGAWRVRDTGSSNGTLVNRAPVTERGVVHGDRIDFGRVGFYAVFEIGPLENFPAPVVITCTSPTSLRILEPTGGNGGLVALANVSAQLTATQLELVEASVATNARRRSPADRGARLRAQLGVVGVLSWDARDPDDTHVKQLVRRIRRTFLRSGLGDLIESRHRLGYRLRSPDSAATNDQVDEATR